MSSPAVVDLVDSPEAGERRALARSRFREEHDGEWSYAFDEARAARFLAGIADRAVGAGTDPVGFLMASYALLAAKSGGARAEAAPAGARDIW